MPALTKSLYLAWKKPRLEQEVSFLNGFDRSRSILLRLAEEPPYTLFSLYTAAALKADKKRRQLTAIAPPQAQMLLAPFTRLFDEVIPVDATPGYGSKPFKALREEMLASEFDVFCDLDPKPLPELAVLSKANLRMTYYQNKLYPFFNILFRQSGDEDLLERSLLMTRLLVDEVEIERTMPKPKIDQNKASEWLKRHGIFKNKSYILTSIPFEVETLKGMRVISSHAWEGEADELKAALFTSAAYYVGKLDRGFEMSYLMGTPSVLVISDKEQAPQLPASPFVKSVIRSTHPTSEVIEGALSGKTF